MINLPALIEIDVDKAADREILAAVHRLLEVQHQAFHFLYRELTMSKEAIDALTAQVARLTSVDASAVALLSGLKSSLDAAIAKSADTGDDSALKELSTQIGTQTDALAAAVAANTPAAAAAPAPATPPAAPPAAAPADAPAAAPADPAAPTS